MQQIAPFRLTVVLPAGSAAPHPPQMENLHKFERRAAGRRATESAVRWEKNGGFGPKAAKGPRASEKGLER